tara:strand:- start:101 stop:442 length:342 start_codon:yes stop_codon:yes gene_type:complete
MVYSSLDKQIDWRTMKSKVSYTKTKPNTQGIVKDYSKVNLELSRHLVGSVGIGFGNDSVIISLEDVEQLINLRACIDNALDKINLDKAESIEFGQSWESDIFVSQGSRATKLS